MLGAPPLKITTHAIWQYRKRAVHCCERDRSDQALRTVIEKQVLDGNWRLAGGDTFVVECGPLVPKKKKPWEYKTASVSYTFVVERRSVVTVLGFMMRPNPRAVQKRRRRQRLMREAAATLQSSP
jgi:hypothetical protein